MWNASWRRAGDGTDAQSLTRRRLDLLFGSLARFAVCDATQQTVQAGTHAGLGTRGAGMTEVEANKTLAPEAVDTVPSVSSTPKPA
jgi:hypothetical protein